MVKKEKTKRSGEPVRQKPLRLWPGVVIAFLLLLVRFGTLIVAPEAVVIAMYGGVLCGLAVIIWWAFFSRAPRIERWGAVVLMIGAMFLTIQILHESIAKAGMGLLFPILAVPFLSLAFVVWAAVCGRLSVKPRRITMVATILVACGAWALLRTGGLDASFKIDIDWRWRASDEELLLARTDADALALPPVSAVTETESEWSGFRGPHRNGIIRGSRIGTDWTASPPVELWRRPVGPGWSSFAVHGDLFVTQEQRGDDEIVACYNIKTGEPVWRHSDPTRFWESNSGPGPRGTPTLSGGRVYALGATGIMNVLDVRDGSVIWSRSAATDTDTKVPYWGVASSPLVTATRVIVAVAGSLVAYDPQTGDLLWTRPVGGDCYSSPHQLEIDGVEQVLLQNEAGVMSVAPADGALLWEHAWPGQPIVQPAPITSNDILISVDEGSGVRRISVLKEGDGWKTEERWTSARLKPYFNDSAIHDGHAFGFDGPLLACIDIEDGARKWRGGRYGRGQFVLLADQDLLLVLSEKGELALVKAVPDAFAELARFPAIEGKTWNHPVLVGDVLLVRNGREMAAFRLPLAEG